ncbi:MAG: VOC family protein [Parvularcula sp.]|jgi:catechol 2,3-dioxygenase-like lactoylglutathione lyase family enzyme|nr:VOC family protein [Parvularcula sp.]
MERMIATAFLTFFINIGVPAMSEPLTDIRPFAVTLSVPEIAATAAWYETVLGFTPVQTKAYPEFQTELMILERDGFRIELIRDGNAQPGPFRPDAPGHTGIHGMSQFSFETDDLAALKDQLVEHGVATHFEFENEELGVRFLFVRDPNGNLVQFLQRL